MPDFQAQQPPPCRQPRPARLQRLSRDARGYTLPTVIVSAILLAAAAGAGVILYRGWADNTDVRAFSDLSAEYAPGRPHSFSHTSSVSAADDPTARIVTVRVSWSAPETGAAGATAAGLTYPAADTKYLCKDSNNGQITLENIGTGDANDHIATSPDTQTPAMDLTQPALPPLTGNQMLLGSGWPSGAGVIGHCLLRVQARTAAGELGPAGEYRFSISRIPTAPENARVELTSMDKLAVFWDTPSYLGVGDLDNVIYRVQRPSEARMESEDPGEYDPTKDKCTLNNFYILDKPDEGEVWDLRVIPVVVTNSAQMATFRQNFSNSDGSYSCPGTNHILQTPTPTGDAKPIPGTYLELLGLQPAVAVPAMPAAGRLSLEPVGTSGDASKLVEDGRSADTVTIRADWSGPPEHDSYLLEWSRADGAGISHNLETADTVAFLQLDHGAAYNFKLRAGNSSGYSSALEDCTVVAIKNRHLAPEITAVPVGSFNLAITISNPDQTQYCPTATYCLDPAADTNECQPAKPKTYRVRAFTAPTGNSSCDNPPTSSFPNKTCRALANQDQVTCIPVDSMQPTKPLQHIFNVQPDEDYAIEAITGHECTDGALTNNGASNDESYPSFPALIIASTEGTEGTAVGDMPAAVENLAIEPGQVWDSGLWGYDEISTNRYSETITLTHAGVDYPFTITEDFTKLIEPADAPFTITGCDVAALPGGGTLRCVFRFTAVAPTALGQVINPTGDTSRRRLPDSSTGLRPDTTGHIWQVSWDIPSSGDLQAYVLKVGGIPFNLLAGQSGIQTLSQKQGIDSALCDFGDAKITCWFAQSNASPTLSASVTAVYANSIQTTSGTSS